jgi:hypothetical protein
MDTQYYDDIIIGGGKIEVTTAEGTTRLLTAERLFINTGFGNCS